MSLGIERDAESQHPSAAAQGPLPATPLPGDQLGALTQAVTHLEPEQLWWASGYLAGLAQRQTATPIAATVPQAAQPLAKIIYLSETGNGRRVAEQLAQRLGQEPLTVEVLDGAELRPRHLTRETHLYWVVSTHGEGDPPQGCEELFKLLGGSRAPRLDQLKFSVLALGDRSYEHFCAAGSWLHHRLVELGATPLRDVVECDVDFQQQAEAWSNQVNEELRQLDAEQTDNGVAGNVISMPLRQASATNEHGYDADQPVSAEILENQPITTPDALRPVHHLELGLGEARLSWQPGDALGIIHRNPLACVDQLLELTRADGDQLIELQEEHLRLRDAMLTRLEVTRLHWGFVERYRQLARQPALDQYLDSLDAPARRALLNDDQIVDVIRRWPARLNADQLQSCLRPTTPRLYSIASAREWDEQEIHLTVAHLTDQREGAARRGAASDFLCQMEAGDQTQIYIKQNPAFHLPADPLRPLILIGAGTGIAPYRAFLQARESLGQGGPIWLLFGNRHRHADFLYQIEWLRARQRGQLQHLDVAFSRDGIGPRYVQHALAQQQDRLQGWLADGAHLYVCGSIAMGQAIDQQLKESIDDQRLMQIKDENRYHRDVY